MGAHFVMSDIPVRFGVRDILCYALSRRLMHPPDVKDANYGAYHEWRDESLRASWQRGAFSESLIDGKDVLDFGCGDGQLAGFLMTHMRPASISGVDVEADAIRRAREKFPQLEFRLGGVDRLPFPDQSFDTIIAFDCMEHVMDPLAIMREWRRVLRPGGKCAIEWFPFHGPWGPHMDVLIPIPWAHVIFGERAMFRAAARIYDDPDFVPRHWDLDESGLKKPNKWKAWSSFEEQGYLNELDVPGFKLLARRSSLTITRFDKRSFAGNPIRRAFGDALSKLPLIGHYFVIYTVIELRRDD